MRIFLGLVLLLMMMGCNETPPQIPQEPKLSWEFSVVSEDQKILRYFHKSLNFQDPQHGISWKKTLPLRMQEYSLAVGEGEIQTIQKQPGSIKNLVPSFFDVVLLLDHIVIADISGILVVDIKDGKTIKDIPVAKKDSPAFFCDEGSFRIKSPAIDYSGSVNRGACFGMDDHTLLYFNGQTLVIVDTESYTILHEAGYEQLQKKMLSPAKTILQVKLGDYSIEIVGVTYL